MTLPCLITPLPHRAILEVQGEDRATFLQGLITNDIQKMTPFHSIYTLLLTAKGRFLYDLFITERDGVYLIDAEADRLGDLLKKLSLYKLRSQVTLSLRPDLPVFALWGEGVGATLDLQLERGATRDCIFIDPRLVEMGARAIGVSEIAGCQTTSLEAYHQYRLQLGVPEGGQDLIPEKTIPLEAGLDELGAISWTKGCYLGQELTARTKHIGLVRKRVFPVTLEGAPPPKGAEILKNGDIVGDMLTHSGPYGLARLRLEALETAGDFTCADSLLIPHRPFWMTLPEVTA